jgi:hypothetical protein
MRSELDSAGDEGTGIDLIRLLRKHGRTTGTFSVALTAVVTAVALAYLFWIQPVRRSSVLEFRPTFEGAATGEYPNELPFASSDIAAAQNVDLVYDANLISEYCSRETFRSGFFVEQRSDQSAFLDAEYQARLSDTRITAVERQRIQAEYEAKRAALPVEFRLVFVKPRPCAAIPQVVVTKSMADVLSTWASESESKRGVLKLQIDILTPAMLDVGAGVEGGLLLKADLLRTSMWRIIDNVQEVEKLPGSGLIRMGAERLAFMEVRNKLIDLVRSRLDPLVVSSGQSMVRESSTWVQETVASAERDQQAAEGRATAYQTALQQYSGNAQVAAANRAVAPQGGVSDVQTISPQIDRTFIDRIVEMSEANTTFRQKLTQSMVDARVESVAAAERASYYRRLLTSMSAPRGNQMSVAEIERRLDSIVEQGKALTKQFNDLYLEFSRVSLRPAAAMYQTDKPVTTEVYREFTPNELLTLVVGTFLVTLLSAFGFFVIRDRLKDTTTA